MPDYNPDKEAHHKHKFIVHDATRRGLDGIHTSKGYMKFNREGRFMVSDEKLAREIQTEVDQNATVTRVRWDDPADRGHTYFFTTPGLPWHKYDELGRRIKEDEDEIQRTD